MSKVKEDESCMIWIGDDEASTLKQVAEIVIRQTGNLITYV